MRSWKCTFALALVLGLPACKRAEPPPAATPDPAVTPAPAGTTPAPDEAAAAPEVAPKPAPMVGPRPAPPQPVIDVPDEAYGPDPAADPASWRAEVKAAWDTLRGLPEEPRPRVMQETMALARLGADALPALRALTFGDLPEPHRAYAAIFLAEHHRFDPETLARMAKTPHPFLRRQAVEHLAALGGPGHRALLEALGRSDPTVRPFTQRAIEGMPSEQVPIRAVSLLHQMVTDPDEAAREAAAARLRVEFAERLPSMEALLRPLLASPISDRVTQHLAAQLLVAGRQGDLSALRPLTARSENRFVRLAAVKALLALGADGRREVERLLAMQDEPLEPQIRPLLGE